MKIIAYGSLMNQKSLETTLQRRVKLKKTKLCDFVRIFNAPFSEYAFLNLIEDQNSIIEVAYFNILPKELKLFTKREKGSILKEVKPGYFAFVWPENKNKNLPVLQSYLDICEKGARDLNIDFWRNTIVPEKIINDRQNPQY